MNVAHLLVSQARHRPDAAAMIEPAGGGDRAISFAQLDEQSARCAEFLVDAGLAAGDPVLVFVPMSIDLYLALIAIFRIGAVAVFLDPSAGADHINRCCQAVNPRAMIAVAKAHVLRLTCRALRRIPRKFTVGWPIPGARRWEHWARCSPLRQIAPREDADAALVSFTSGSTGSPKGAVRSHGFLAAQHAALARAIELAPGQIHLVTLPIFSLANFASGGASVIPDGPIQRPGFIQPAPVLRQMARYKITRCVASPAFFERGLDNLLIPLGAFAFLRLYQQASVHALAIRLAVAIVMVLFALSWRRRSTLNDSALIAGALFAYAAAMLGGPQWLIGPVVLFLLHVILWPRYGPRREHTVYAVVSVTLAGLFWLMLQSAYGGTLRFFFPYAVGFGAHLAIIGVSGAVVAPTTPARWRRLINSILAGWAMTVIQMIPALIHLAKVPSAAQMALAAGAGLCGVALGALGFYALLPILYGPKGSNAAIHSAGLASALLGAILAAGLGALFIGWN